MTYMKTKVKVGDEVGVARVNRSYGGFTSSMFGTVTKINGHGHIFVQVNDTEYRFDKYGDSYKNNYGPSLMCPDILRKSLAEIENQKNTSRVVRELEKVISQGWTGSGKWNLTETRLSEIESLIANLKEIA